MDTESIGIFALQWVILAVMLFGEVGILTTIIPGLNIIWLSALVYWLVTGFNWINGIALAIMTILMVAGNLADNVLIGAGARQTGASWLAIGAALLGGIIGSIIWPPFGGLIAAMVILFVIEFIRLKDWRKAFKSVGNMAAGCGVSVVVRLLVGVFMIFLWILVVFVVQPV